MDTRDLAMMDASIAPDASVTTSGAAGGQGGQGTTGRGGRSSGTSGSSSGGRGGASSTPDVDAASPVAPTTPRAGTCETALALKLPARRQVTTLANAVGSDTSADTITVRRDALFDTFLESCGLAGCHGGGDDPLAQSPAIFKVTRESFSQRPNIGTQTLERVLSDDPVRVMPPGSGDGSQRRSNDPLRVMAERMVEWQEAGFPDEFEVINPLAVITNDLPDDPYLLDMDVADELTPVGNCIPGPTPEEHLATEEMLARDAMFEAVSDFDDLPQTLFETDLVSLDNAVLSRRRVYSYAPGYTLYSDHAEKMRYVRVPVGKTIKYDAKRQEFQIPDNTRFYKTFLKRVIDADGNEVYRKMETRLILARVDENRADGSRKVRSFPAVYAWSSDEQTARLVTDPLRNGKPFSDRVCPYVTDETVPRDPDTNPIIERVSEACEYMTLDEMEDPASGQIRHYGIPSRERCDQCHMGSNARSYILGFSPFHVDRRPVGEGGVYEAPGQSEVDQLQRLIDYGVIEGIEPGEAKLEESQGEREPRNEFELVAQAYVLSNCSFCHNPDGFPSIQNPVLKGFDMLPSEKGGLFQFPLEKFSPRAKVGPLQSLRFPYITPAFADFVAEDGYVTTQSARGITKTIVVNPLKPPTNDWIGSEQIDSSGKLVNHPDQFSLEYDVVGELERAGELTPTFQFIGPWRSLIWRNVYTPFTYQEDNTIFIHMPRNVPGYDCRAQRILGEWMLSIPSVPKIAQPAIYYDDGTLAVRAKLPFLQSPGGFEQPYMEVRPGDHPFEDLDKNDPSDLAVLRWFLPNATSYGYERAVEDALERVETFRQSLTYQHCPEDEDIVDPAVLTSPKRLGSEKKVQPAPVDTGTLLGPRVNELAAGELWDEVPDHAHWVQIDTTDPPGRWQPRRTNWKQVLVDRQVEVSDSLNVVIDALHGLRLDEQREAFSTEPLPMGLWHPQCRTSAVAQLDPSVDELQLDELVNGPRQLHRWLFDRDTERGQLMLAGPDLRAAPVHHQSRGEAVFRAICLNCHGKDMDSRSPLASTIGELTGGETRVANFVDGIFGPRPAPGAFAEEEFLVNGGATPAEWQARYMVFMGLGGTEAEIPPVALELVRTSPFYGSVITSGRGVTDANMLESARSVCQDVLDSYWDVRADLIPNLTTSPSGRIPFVKATAHFELWSSLCSYDNVPIVRVLDGVSTEDRTLAARFFFKGRPQIYRAQDYNGAWIYPEDHPVGTQAGYTQLGIKSGNTLPWCVAPRNAADYARAVELFAREGLTEEGSPFCPPELLATAFDGTPIHLVVGDVLQSNGDFVSAWTLQGAINAGVAAYYYLDGVTKGQLVPSLDFDTCDEEEGAAPPSESQVDDE